MSAEPSLTEIIQRAIESRATDIFTGMVCQVQTYYPESQTADLIPAVNRPIPTEDEDIITETLPVIPNVKVVFPRAGQFSITFPIVPGDFVFFIASTFSMSQWAQSGQVPSDPGDIRQNHMASGVCIAGIAPNAGALPNAQTSLDALCLVGPDVRLGAADATAFVALASLVNAELANIAAALSSALSADPGSPVSYGSPYSPGDVSATLVKAK